jgi:hypothetical protein
MPSNRQSAAPRFSYDKSWSPWRPDLTPRMDLMRCGIGAERMFTVRRASSVGLRRFCWQVRKHPKVARKHGFVLAWLVSGEPTHWWRYSASPFQITFQESPRKPKGEGE